ncbi:ABC transporter ATP-binding protein [Donghicola tyrosinivorans]|uniref:Multiple sugar transport system ATP-binding protein/multiple sugar transport system ATP-binding protein n=1 Tax=Donghicola tyrosinivorans TaxID=1652492 RepID=A0A2T0WDM0_9RHOB|nr:ATP-binding cassette domain-containing protein [Donghicola tyrosinivorans]PRY84808.1 multiple sugar transport system ATP-binding protein/multiple sugar transport system ATP-binding protein [Donghicola tyrosinivorans]
MADVLIQSVTKRYGTVEVVPSLNLEIPEGSFTVLVGPSGCGKSTLLRMIAGLETVSDGKIFIGGTDITHTAPSQRGVAMVFQSYALYPHMSVAENIGFGLRLAGMGKSEMEGRVREAADILQLGPLLDRKPKQLSGGQRQRVAIGRAIVRKPKVFLFDEPLSNLDAALRAQMRVELSELHERLGSTMVYVTHDQVEAMTMADQIVVLNKGHIEQVGAPMHLYNAPATPFVAGFIGSPKMNFLQGPKPWASAPQGALIGIRPEHITLSQTGGQWPATVRHVEHLGGETLVHLDSECVGSLTVKVTGDLSAQAGTTLHASPRPEMLHVFTDGQRVSA